jgi:cyclophilin family peptidyl-prolyl cis-trans isomerase
MSRSKSRRRRPRKKKSNTKKTVLIVALLVAVAAIIVAYNMLGNNVSNENGSTQNITSTQMKVLLETSKGNITIQLRDDMPSTTDNFKNLVQQGVYNGTIFHRVIADFMIQGGDPTTGTWSGGSIPNIKDEFSEKAENNKHSRSTVAMAKQSDPTTGQMIPNSASSQFFINVEYNSHLDNGYSVFGEVIDGMTVVDRISKVPTDGDPPNGANKPLEDVTLIKAQLID